MQTHFVTRGYRTLRLEAQYVSEAKGTCCGTWWFFCCYLRDFLAERMPLGDRNADVPSNPKTFCCDITAMSAFHADLGNQTLHRFSQILAFVLHRSMYHWSLKSEKLGTDPENRRHFSRVLRFFGQSLCFFGGTELNTASKGSSRTVE